MKPMGAKWRRIGKEAMSLVKVFMTSVLSLILKILKIFSVLSLSFSVLSLKKRQQKMP